jgi:hypothetical protein
MKNWLADGHGIARGHGFSTEGNWEKGSVVSKTVTIEEPNGTKYVGEHKNGIKDGKGVLTFRDGNSYKGDFKDGAQDGEGEEILAGGQRYVGRFRAGKFNGKGTLYVSDGGKITGEWKDSKLDGVGTYTTANGESFKVRMNEKGLERVE